MKRQYQDDAFEFDRLNLLGQAFHGLTDAGEVLVTLDGIPDGDREAWIDGFSALAERRHTEAEAYLASGHPIGARRAYLRAAAYFATASSAAPGTKKSDRYGALWERHRACWDAAVPLFEPPVEPIRIPYESTTLEGYFFPARSAHGQVVAGGPRPTVIFNNGSDGPVTAALGFARAANERGWHAMTFDGPGQNASLHRQHLYFRSDWEAVVTPVADWLVARADVDAARLALVGVSQAGYWVPRAVAFEHRIAAAVADPGVVRVGDSWRAHLPDVMIQLLDQGDKSGFDSFMEVGMKDDPAAAAMLAWRMAPYGLTSYFDAYQAADAMHLDADTLGMIACPLLITSPEHEQFWPGQSDEMHGVVPSSTLVAFTEAEGADWHCEPAAQGLRTERIFNWLEDQLHDGRR
jgi:hypothetical protein